jgi:putative thioredoxin
MTMLLGQKPKAAPAPIGAAKPGDVKPGAIKDVSFASFEADVIAASDKQPVIVDFWASWCGPCKQLGPLLEKTVAATKGRAVMVKVNIDENPEIAQALRIQSIPTVYAFYKGRPIDGFMGAVPESQLKKFIDKVLQQAGSPQGDETEHLLAMAEAAFTAGQPAQAQQIFAEVLAEDAANPLARGGLARVAIAAGQHDTARAILKEAPTAVKNHAALHAAQSALDLAEQSAKTGPVLDLQKTLEKNPEDHQARFDLALAYYAAGLREKAVDELLEIVRRDRAWNEEAARKQLVKLFEAFGLMDPLSIDARKRLSSLLFS